jgi:uncharacterized protein YraI
MFCIIFSSTPTVQAATFLNYKVKTTESVKMYKSTSTSSKVLYTIPKNTTLTVKSRSGSNWGKVGYNATNGWIDLRKTSSTYSVSVPMVKQTKSNTCGSASGSMVLKARGKSVSEMTFWNYANSGGEGTYVYRVCGTLNHFLGSNWYVYKNLSSSSVNTYYNRIQRSISMGYPVILPLRYSASSEFGYKSNGHYVVVKSIYISGTDCYVKVNDPNTGKVVTLSLNNLVKYNKAHSGYVICKP